MMHRLFLFLLVSASLMGNETRQDTLHYWLPTLVVTASRHPQEAFESHLPIQVVPQARIWEKGVDNLQGVAQEAGMAVVSSGPWSQKFVIRGLEGHNLTLIDGQRLDVLRDYGQHAPLIDVDQIDRIEVIRGPASVLYGSDAIAGVVNILTRRPPSHGPMGRKIGGGVNLRYASVNRQVSETAHLQGLHGPWSWFFSTTRRAAGTLRTPSGVVANTAFSGTSLEAKIGRRLTDRQEIRIGSHLDRMRDVGIPINPYAIEARFLVYDRSRLTASYAYRGSGIFSALEADAYYEAGTRNFRARLERVPNGPLFVNQFLEARRRVKTAGGHIQARFFFSDTHSLVVGSEAFIEFDQTRRVADPVVIDASGQVKKDPPADHTPPTPNANRVGLGIYLEDEYPLFPWLRLVSGLRVDGIQSHAEATPGTLVEATTTRRDRDVSGAVGLVIAPVRTVRLTAHVGRAFKAPTLQQRFFKGTAQVGFLTGDPNLHSETSLNLDAGIKWQTGRWEGEVGVFKNRVDDLIVMAPVDVTSGTYRYANVGRAALWGGECRSEVRLFPWVSALIRASYVRGEDRTTHEPLPQIPPLSGSLGFRFSAGRGIWFDLAAEWVDRQDRVAANERTTPGYRLFHLFGGLSLKDWFSIPYDLAVTVGVRNACNTRYREHLSTVTWADGPGRNVVVGLKGTF